MRLAFLAALRLDLLAALCALRLRLNPQGLRL